MLEAQHKNYQNDLETINQYVKVKNGKIGNYIKRLMEIGEIGILN